MRAKDTLERADPARSLRPEIRNPLLKLRAAAEIRALPPQARHALAALLLDLSRDAKERAEKSWSRNKAPMAAYWKAVSVYAGHLHRVARPAKAERGIPSHGRLSGETNTPARSKEAP